MSIWDQQEGRVTRNGRLVHTAPAGSAVKFLVADRGQPIALVVGPTHAPYYLFRTGECWSGFQALPGAETPCDFDPQTPPLTPESDRSDQG